MSSNYVSYNEESLRESVYNILPIYRKVDEAGAEKIVLPSLLKMVADKFFISSLDNSVKESEVSDYQVCQSAMSDLFEHGQLKFNQEPSNKM